MLFKGVATAMVTPFTEDASAIDFAAFERLIEFQIANKVDALVFLGSTGEPPTMSEKEKHEVIQFAVEKVNKRVPVIIGTGSNDTNSTIEASLYAEQAGADGLLIVTPYYNKCTQNGLVAHFNAVCDRISIPAIIYNVPARTGVNIDPATLERIIRHKNVAGIKEASSNIIQACRYAKILGDKAMWCGDDEILLPMLSLGAAGVISVTSNIIPKFVHDFCQAFWKGDNKKALEMQKQAQDFAGSMFCEVNPIPVKAATKLLGLTNGRVRMPLSELEPQNLEKVKAAMVQLGLI